MQKDSKGDPQNGEKTQGFQTITLRRDQQDRLEAYDPSGDHIPGLGMWFCHKYGNLPLKKTERKNPETGNTELEQTTIAHIRIHPNPKKLVDHKKLSYQEGNQIPCPPTGKDLEWYALGPGKHKDWQKHATPETGVPGSLLISQRDVVALCWARNYDLLFHLTQESNHLRYQNLNLEPATKPLKIEGWSLTDLWKTNGRVPLTESLHTDISQGPDEFKTYLRKKLGNIPQYASKGTQTDWPDTINADDTIYPEMEDFREKTPAAWRDLVHRGNLRHFQETQETLTQIVITAFQTERPSLDKALKIASALDIINYGRTPLEKKATRMKIRNEATKSGTWRLWQDRIFNVIFTKKDVMEAHDYPEKREFALWLTDRDPQFFVNHQDAIPVNEDFLEGYAGSGKQLPEDIANELWKRIKPINVIRWLLPGMPVDYKAPTPVFETPEEIQAICEATIEYFRTKKGFQLPQREDVKPRILHLLERNIIENSRIQDVFTAVKKHNAAMAEEIRKEFLEKLV